MPTPSQVHFQQATDPSQLDPLKSSWRETLTAPQDGMWETLTGYATHWEIKEVDRTIGYACVDGENRLLQFYVLPAWMENSPAILQAFLQEQQVEQALLGTNNPLALSAAMHWQQSVAVHTNLFSDFLEVETGEIEGIFRATTENDLDRLVDFCHESMNAPKEWLSGYLGNLIARKEIYVLEKGEEVLGTCEVRKSDSDPTIADVGMVVAPNHRRKGIATYLIRKAKELAYEQGRKPICSCEKDNIGSLKSIQKSGFRTMHQMVLMQF